MDSAVSHSPLTPEMWCCICRCFVLRGGDLTQDVFNLYEKGRHEPLLFQLLKCNRAQFLDCGCPCCFGDAPNQAFVPGFWEASIFLCVSQNFQHADRKESVKFLIYVQSKSINARRGPCDLPLEGLLNQLQGPVYWYGPCGYVAMHTMP